MKKITTILTTLLILLSVSQLAEAADVRCGRSLISRGDHQGEVISACGEPLLTSKRTIYRSGIPRRQLRLLGFDTATYANITSGELLHHNRSVVEVPVDVWTYNFGPRKFMREITFIDGRVVYIKTLGYGH